MVPNWIDETKVLTDACPALEGLARENGAKFLTIEPELTCAEFKAQNRHKLPLIVPLYSLVERGILSRYDVEYGTIGYEPFARAVREHLSAADASLVESVLQTDCMYASDSPLLGAGAIFSLVGPDFFGGDGVVVDVGSGTGNLLEAANRWWGLPAERLIGVEQSPAGAAIIGRKFKAHSGAIADVVESGTLEQGLARLVVANYFIDRDKTPRKSFEAMNSLLRRGSGRLLVCGKFPVQPYDRHELGYADQGELITTGDNVAQDAEQLIRYLSEQFGLKLSALAVTARKFFGVSDLFEALGDLMFVFDA